jgi:hypothetical protein
MKALAKNSLRSLMVVPALALALSFVAPVTVGAQACDPNNLSISSGADCAQGNEQATDLFGETGIFRQITNILLFLVGAISVIMLIIGGVRYVVSGGDQAAVTSAKNTILYAIIGIVVAFLAFAAVNFVTTQLAQP